MDTGQCRIQWWYHLQPSMEPRPFSHGYGRTARAQDRRAVPSMEPRLFSHGCADKVGRGHRLDRPSMEPRPFSHGYGLPGIDQADDIIRAFKGAMTFQPWILQPVVNGLPVFVYLQWSRSLSAMDTPPRRSRLSTATRRFNGGHGLSAMDTDLLLMDAHQWHGLQWSHDFAAMDTSRADRAVLSAGAPSMEPRLFSHGYNS